MTRAESILASRLLDLAAEEFGKHGCNDTDPELFEGLTEADLAELEESFNDWKRGETGETGGNPEQPYTKLRFIGDHIWMAYLAAVVGRNIQPEIDRLKAWISDLQSGMYVNCVYCGHRYGPNPGTPITMAEILRRHVEQCPEHPMSKLKHALEESVKLQAHYAKLLNMHDGGKRMIFESPEEWIARLEDLPKIPPHNFQP